MPKVNFTHQEYKSLKPRWDLIRDCISGEKAVKDKGDIYLPRPNPGDTSKENKDRYDSYRQRAVFYNVTSRTQQGLVGQVFAKDPVVEIPETLKALETDPSGSGIDLVQLASKATAEVLAFGRGGLLVDYPKTEGPATVAQLEAGEIRPKLIYYQPWDIINWRTRLVGSKVALSLVVISESMVTDDDGFESETELYYRELRLTEEGIYISRLWYWDDKVNDFVIEEESVPLDSTGKPWREIPFTFIGANNNDSACDLPPLYDLASLNIAHYRNSADYEESCFQVGQPTPVLTGLTEEWVSQVLKGQVHLGSRSAIALPEGGSAMLLQASPNSMPKEAMEHKERQMVALGAKLVEQKAVQRTATEAGIEEASTSSVLSKVAGNVNSAIRAALRWACRFVGADEETVNFELNKDFQAAKLTSNELTALVSSWQSKAITFEEMRDSLKRGGIAYLDDEEARQAIDSESLDMGLPADDLANDDPANSDGGEKATQ